MSAANGPAPGPLAALALAATAHAEDDRFVAPGLWRITSRISGPMGQQSVLTQQQCWDRDGNTSHGTVAFPGSHSQWPGQTTHGVSTLQHRSTVHLNTILATPKGPVTQAKTQRSPM